MRNVIALHRVKSTQSGIVHVFASFTSLDSLEVEISIGTGSYSSTHAKAPGGGDNPEAVAPILRGI